MQSRSSPGFDPSIHRHSGIGGSADEAEENKKNTPKNQLFDMFKGTVQRDGSGQN
jgi:hypothetical protein